MHLCAAARRDDQRKTGPMRELGDEPPLGTVFAFFGRPSFVTPGLGNAMNLTLWIPGLFLLGLAAMGLMFAFVAGCDRV